MIEGSETKKKKTAPTIRVFWYHCLIHHLGNPPQNTSLILKKTYFQRPNGHDVRQRALYPFAVAALLGSRRREQQQPVFRGHDGKGARATANVGPRRGSLLARRSPLPTADRPPNVRTEPRTAHAAAGASLGQRQLAPAHLPMDAKHAFGPAARTPRPAAAPLHPAHPPASVKFLIRLAIASIAKRVAHLTPSVPRHGPAPFQPIRRRAFEAPVAHAARQPANSQKLKKKHSWFFF